MAPAQRDAVPAPPPDPAPLPTMALRTQVGEAEVQTEVSELPISVHVRDAPPLLLPADTMPLVLGGTIRACDAGPVWLNESSGATAGAAAWRSRRPPVAARRFLHVFDICIPEWSEGLRPELHEAQTQAPTADVLPTRTHIASLAARDAEESRIEEGVSGSSGPSSPLRGVAAAADQTLGERHDEAPIVNASAPANVSHLA